MLYGMDDEESEYKEEFKDFIEEKHINFKKVFLIIGIIFGSICGIMLITIIIFKMTTSTVEIRVENVNENSTIVENNVEEDVPELESNIQIVENSAQINNMYIAPHIIESQAAYVLPVENPNGAQEIRNIYFSDEKQVYLTFDDGPSRDITPQILDILKQYNVKATFFVLGSRVELYPDTLKRELEEGHYIANHGYSHVYSKIYENKDTVFDEYVRTENCIKNALENQDYNSYLFRFPGGSSGGVHSKVKSEARDLFNSYGVAFTNWNCLTGDAENKTTKEACFDEMIRTKADQNSIILLMHDANDKTQTVEVLPQIIEYFQNEGYTFKNFYEIFREKESEEIINEEEKNNNN